MTDTVTITTQQQLRERLAAELHRIADDVVDQEYPIGRSVTLNIGVLAGRDDLERWAIYLGAEIDEDGGTTENIPNVDHEIRFDDKSWGPSLTVRAQIQPDRRQTELEAKLAGGAQ